MVLKERLTKIFDDEIALFVVDDLGVLVGYALPPADGVAAHQDAVRGGGQPHHSDLIGGGLNQEQ